MDKTVTALLNPGLVATAASQWHARGETTLLDDVTNFVYAFESPSGRAILRLTHSSHHTEAEILAELDWINYLTDHGVPACRPLPSRNTRLAEVCPVDGSYFVAVASEYAPGRFIDEANPEEWNAAFFRAFGKTVGKMHAVTKHYAAPQLGQKRPQWHEEDTLRKASDYLPADQKLAATDLEKLLARFGAAQPSRDSYGLVHGDLNPTNFFVLNGQITLFDFDDCAYNWFINDIAVAMPRYSPLFSTAGWEAPFTEFFQQFMRGYSEENHLEPIWLDYLPDSLRLQNIITLIACHQSNVPDSQYRSFYELVLRVYRQGHPLFAFDFRRAWAAFTG